MNPKSVLLILVAILCLFIGRSYTMLQEIENISNYNIQQYTTSVQKIGMVFDWYAVTSKDAIVETAHGVLSCDELKRVLREGKENKDTLLRDYYGTFTPVEASLVEDFRKNDKEYDVFIDRVLDIAERQECKKLDSLIPELYYITGTLQDEVNSIIDIKNQYVVDNNNNLLTSIEHYKEFCMMLCALLLVLCSAFFFKRH